MKRYIFLSAAALLACLQLPAASVWEGSAALSAYGDFPSSGFYAASISFPRNTIVEVKNLENGKTTQVIITKSADTPGILLMLSPEAAQALGIPQNAIARIRVSIPKKANEISALSDTSAAPVKDLDKNPSFLAQAEVAAASKSAQPAPSASPELILSDIAATPPSETPVSEPANSLPEPEVTESAQPAAVAEQPPVTPTETAVEEIPAEATEPIAEPVAEIAAETPPTEAEEAAAGSEIPAEPAEVSVVPVVIPDFLPIEEEIAAVPETELAAETEEPSLETILTPIPENSIVSLEPTEPNPPPPVALETVPEAAVEAVVNPEPALPAMATVETVPTETEPPSVASAATSVSTPPQPEAVAPVETTPNTVAEAAGAPTFNALIVDALQKGKAYVQIAAYAKPDMVAKVVDAVMQTYPVVLVRAESGAYRILIGPLGEDEAGVVLVGSRASGYPDAFVRREK
jgi:hypothetical protein